jgi:hypothetical protein
MKDINWSLNAKVLAVINILIIVLHYYCVFDTSILEKIGIFALGLLGFAVGKGYKKN